MANDTASAVVFEKPYSGNTKKAFPDMIDELIRAGIIEKYANVEMDVDPDYFDIEYGNGGPAALANVKQPPKESSDSDGSDDSGTNP